ncbi:arylsulfatase [Gaetbulibacter sp. M240]|uniref:sulfatase family protein n=1 Tax=Gaetbulibacter sp. M240 TaxID=3126511 RepID=UPI00374E5E13
MKIIQKIPLTFYVLYFLLGSCKKGAEREFLQKDEKPNIIYVLADDLGIGDVRVFNENGKIKTPNIDQLAQQGMIFTDAHTSSSVCTPTRYGIITGRYNWRSPLKRGVLYGGSEALIPKSRETVASLLKNNNYYTAFIGKWHLGWSWPIQDDLDVEINKDFGEFQNIDFTKAISNGPNDLGFDYSYGIAASLDMPPYVYVENGLPTTVPDTVSENKDKMAWWRKGPIGSDFVHEEVTPNVFNKTFKFIRERAQKSKPFFIYLALPSPHTPILPTKDFQGKSGLNPYADFVMEIDAYMGQLEATIKKAGIEKNTIIVFTSDNGCSPRANFTALEELGHDPSAIYRGTKSDIFEGGHRVPFIVKWPAKIKPGSVCDVTVCTTDFFATCADILGDKIVDNEAEDSFSMLPLWINQYDSFKREATIHSSITGSFSIREGDYKLIMDPGSGGWSPPNPKTTDLKSLPEIQLYNVKLDPSETTNIYLEHPKVVSKLKLLLEKQILNGRSTPGQPQENDSVSNWKQIDWIYKSKIKKSKI